MRKKKKKNIYIEVKGLILISFAFLFFLSILSFDIKNPQKNYLGIIGYCISWFSVSIFGLGSYLISIYSAYLGINFIKKKNTNFKFKTFCFSILLISTCFLLNILAENIPEKIAFFKQKIFIETIYITNPNPKIITRYNLGGVPFYYLYNDLPLLNLKKLLSNIGMILIFCSSFVISFILSFGVSFISKIKSLFSKSLNIFKKPVVPQKEFIFEKNKIREPIKKKSYVTFKKKELPKKTFYKNFNSSYNVPHSSLLSNPIKIDTPFLKKELNKQAEILEATLKSFGIKAKVGEINCGPTITSFELHPAIGVKVQKIKILENDIALNLQAKSMRIIAPIPGKAAVGVEIPSLHPQTVSLKEMLNYYHQVKRKFSVPLLLGKTVSGDHVITDLVKMPHLLIAGATGSGKSACINTIVMSILMNISPDEIKLIMIDPKKVELTQYSTLPHMIAPVITESNGAYAALQWLVQEMKKRYEILKQLALRNIFAFNNRKIKKDFEDSLSIDIPKKFPIIVAIIDEFADLMLVSSSDLETPIARIAQMARAVGIHLILATQRPSREVITGIIKANFPCRIAFKVSSRINSQIILDDIGAESLLGNGDLLFLPPSSSHLIRAQGAYICDDDINRVISFISKKNPPSYLINSFDAFKKEDLKNSEPKDQLYNQALELILKSKNASTTFLQRKLKIGYARAASLIDELEDNKIIGPQDGSKARKILKNPFIKNFDI
ncbi:MAG: cell division protein FtsK [Chlamydiae bacterium SM23_39]|nr:MAG: cell division protein FtsK [Chlamydiae bacterium SM23_39]